MKLKSDRKYQHHNTLTNFVQVTHSSIFLIKEVSLNVKLFQRLPGGSHFLICSRFQYNLIEKLEISVRAGLDWEKLVLITSHIVGTQWTPSTKVRQCSTHSGKKIYIPLLVTRIFRISLYL